MTPEQQQIAIAKTCGWTAEQDSNGYWRATNKKSGYAFELWVSERNVWSQGIPDYLDDLNACHEMEKVLTYEQIDDYYIELAKRMVRPFRATAGQRAEAFLRILRLWEEEQIPKPSSPRFYWEDAE